MSPKHTNTVHIPEYTIYKCIYQPINWLTKSGYCVLKSLEPEHMKSEKQIIFLFIDLKRLLQFYLQM